MGALRARELRGVAAAASEPIDPDHVHAHAHEDLAPHGGRYDDILDAIGHTPMVAIPRMSPLPSVRIFAKLEATNPTGSVKDRVAKYLVEDLEARGLLEDDSIILEPTSGNTGIALAMIGRRKGYRVALVMPDNVTNERRQMAALFGAEVIDSPGALGSNGAIAMAKYLVSRDERFVMPYQYGNEANPRAHYETTGPEILADCPEIDVFVAGLGTGGTLMGVAAVPARAQAGRPDRRRGAAPRGEGPGPAVARGSSFPQYRWAQRSPSRQSHKYQRGGWR